MWGPRTTSPTITSVHGRRRETGLTTRRERALFGLRFPVHIPGPRDAIRIKDTEEYLADFRTSGGILGSEFTKGQT